MKRDEDYNPEIKSSPLPHGVIFRLAEARDRTQITELMAERNPSLSNDDLMEKTDREILLNATDPNYRLFVADLGDVIGLCRYFSSEGLPKEKIKFPSPAGYYRMGALVARHFRRQGVAKFLFEHRLCASKTTRNRKRIFFC